MSNEAIGILGSIIIFLLSTNAYLIRDLIKQLKVMELQLVRLITQHDTISDLVYKQETELDTLKEQVHEHKNKIDVLYGKYPMRHHNN